MPPALGGFVVDPMHAANGPRADFGRRLRFRSLLALGLVAVLLLAAASTLRGITHLQHDDASTLNAAGRQRMLSQRVAKAALTFRVAEGAAARTAAASELLDGIASWRRAHRALLAGDKSSGVKPPADLRIETALLDLKRHIEAVGEAARTLVARLQRVPGQPDPAVAAASDRILEETSVYLSAMDRIVSHYERVAADRVARLERAGLVLLLASLFVLLGAGRGILEPAVRMIRRQLDELRRSETRYRALTENANDLIIEIDAGRRLLYMSPSHQDVLGMEAERVLGRDCAEFPHPEERAVVVAALTRLFASRTPVEFVTRLRHADGSWRSVEARARYYETAEGEGRAVVVGRDVTERQRAETFRRRLEVQLRETQKLESLGVLAGGVAHDFNNLLTAVLGNAQLAMLDLPPGAPARTRLQRVLAAGKRAAELTGQLFTYAGRGTPAFRVLDLSKLVEEMADLLRVSISKKVGLQCRLASDLPAIEGDATQVRQVVMNLLLNASEALGDREGLVRVETGVLPVDEAWRQSAHLGDGLAHGEHVFLRVSDDGPGMDEATRRRIFDPFYSTKFVGRGLGLAVVLGIARSHRGAVRVESAPDHGTTVTVLFPPSSGTTRSVAPAEVEERTMPLGTGTVLVVDDELDVREVATLMLERLGFRVLTACDGRDAVEVLQARGDEVDAVLLDLTMPRMSGDEALTEMRQLRPGIPAVLMTGYDATFQSARARARELAPYLRKPFSANELGQALSQVLDASARSDSDAE